jgi:hypothetical protein
MWLYRDSNPGIPNPGHFTQSRNPGNRRLQSPDFGIENFYESLQFPLCCDVYKGSVCTVRRTARACVGTIVDVDPCYTAYVNP